MPPAALTKFHRSLERINYTRTRMETLYSEGRIKKIDLESVYEALFLRAVTSFEAFLEALFIDILNGKLRYSRKRVQVRITTKSRGALMDILFQGDKYMPWLPFNHTEGGAKLYLDGGRPFSELTNGDKSVIKTITTIRNAIAHKSNHALGEFQKTVIGSQPLLRGERSPPGFLRSQVSSGTVQNRFEVYIGELGRLASTLC